MMAVAVRCEGTLLDAGGDPRSDAAASLRALAMLGLPRAIVADDDTAIPDELIAAFGDGRIVRPRDLGGVAPLGAEGYPRLCETFGLPPVRVWTLSSSSMDVAVASAAGAPSLHIDPASRGKNAVPDVMAAVKRLKRPYVRAALELRAILEAI